MTETIKDPLMSGILQEIVFNWMEANSIGRLQCDFSGEGDSGSFDGGVTVYPLEAHTQHNSTEWSRIYDLASKYVISPAPPGFLFGVTMAEYVLKLSEEIENNTSHGVDWYNNEGGSGNVAWILDGEGDDGEHYKRGICLTVSERIIEYNTSHFSVRNLNELIESKKDPEE